MISTKALFKIDDTAETVTQRVEATLRGLATLKLTPIALIQGPTFNGGGVAALAEHYAKRRHIT